MGSMHKRLAASGWVASGSSRDGNAAIHPGMGQVESSAWRNW